MYGYGADSVSFGRFMEEPLAWEKWSTFSRNRYVDEAKSYSKPGSVAQKKAYFEAHFKRMAALKAAALLEEQMKNNTNTDVNNYTNVSIQQQGSSGGGIQAAAALLEKQLKNGSTDVVSTQQGSGNEVVVPTATATADAQVEVYDNSYSDDVYHDASEVLTQKSSLSVEAQGSNNDLVVMGVDIAHDSCLSSKPEPDGLEKVNEFENGNMSLPVNHDHDHDKPSSNDDAGVNLSTVIIDEEEEKDLYSVKFERTSEVNVLDSKKRNSGTDLDWGIAKADNILIQVIQQKPSSSNQEEKVPETTPTVTKSKKNPPLSSFIPAVEIGSYASPSASPVRSVRPQVTHPGKENLATPISGKKSSSWLHHETTDGKKRTPLRMTINREFNRFISPVIKKIGSSSKPKSSVDGAVDYPSEIPQSGRRRARVLFDSSPANGSNAQAVGPMGQTTIPSADGAKSPTTSRNKTGAPVMSSFCLRRRDKSAQKRMENLDENERQQPSKSKGKKAKEINKLRHSFCFGARLSSESFRERDRDRSLRTSAIDNSTHEEETLQNGTAGSSLHFQKSSRKTSHHKKTSKNHSSTSS